MNIRKTRSKLSGENRAGLSTNQIGLSKMLIAACWIWLSMFPLRIITGHSVFSETSLKAFGNFVVLHSVIVSSQHRRKGVGTQIVRWAVDFTRKEWPSRTLYVSVIPYGSEATTQEELFGFYFRFGFQRTPDHPYECKLYPSTK